MEGLPKDLRRHIRKWLHPVDGHMYLTACRSAFNHPVSPTMTAEISLYCAKRGYVKLLQYICDPIDDPKMLMNICRYAATGAANYGHVNILEWLKSVHYISPSNLGVEAAIGNQIDTLKWAYLHGYPLTKSCAWYAAKNGNLEMLQWICIKLPIVLYTDASIAAASNGHLNILQWIYEKGLLDMTTDLCAQAAIGGHLNVIRWLREVVDYPWNSKVMQLAASHGHVHLLQWALTNGCPVDKRAWKRAAIFDHVDVLRWGYESGHTMDMEDFRFCRGPKVAAWLESLK
jgi:hypothetical protein